MKKPIGSDWANASASETLPDKIAVVWCVDDVIETDGSLTDQQARLVLQRLEEEHDATTGINWEVIEETIASMRYEGAL